MDPSSKICLSKTCNRKTYGIYTFCQIHTCPIETCDGSINCPLHICNFNGCRKHKMSGKSFCQSHTCQIIDCKGNYRCKLHVCKFKIYKPKTKYHKKIYGICNGSKLLGGEYCAFHACRINGCLNQKDCEKHKCMMSILDSQRL